MLLIPRDTEELPVALVLTPKAVAEFPAKVLTPTEVPELFAPEFLPMAVEYDPYACAASPIAVE